VLNDRHSRFESKNSHAFPAIALALGLHNWCHLRDITTPFNRVWSVGTDMDRLSVLSLRQSEGASEPTHSRRHRVFNIEYV